MKYRVVLTSLRAGVAEDEAARRFGLTFKISATAAMKVIRATPKVIKAGVELETATRYEKAIASCGCVARVESDIDDLSTENGAKPQDYAGDCPAISDVAPPVTKPASGYLIGTNPARNSGSHTTPDHDSDGSQPDRARNAPARFANDLRYWKFALAAGAVLVGGVVLTWLTGTDHAADVAPRAAVSPRAQPLVSAVSPAAVPHFIDVKLPPSGTDVAQITAGQLEVKDGEDSTKQLLLNGKPVPDVGDQLVSIEHVFGPAPIQVVLVSESSGGTACAAMYRLIGFKNDGTTEFNYQFGTCSDLPEVKLEQGGSGTVKVRLSKMDAEGAEEWSLSNGKLSHRDHPSAQAPGPAAPATRSSPTAATQQVAPMERRARRGEKWVMKKGAIVCVDLPSMTEALHRTSTSPLPDACRQLEDPAQQPVQVVRESTPIPGTVIVGYGSLAMVVRQTDLLERTEQAAQSGISNGARQQQAQSDRVQAYAEELATHIERNGRGNPACSAFASNLRTLARSGLPDYVRIRQIDAMFDKAPRVCV